MPHRLSLRTALLAAVAAGAVLVPSTAAFADSTPAPKPSVERSAAAAPAGTTAPTRGSEPTVVPRGGVAAGDSPAPAKVERPAAGKRSAGAAPRGGVAAGERPAGTSGDSTTALAGSAAAAVLVAGAGTVVLRRRSAAQRGR
ncbi:hypothetical protein GCM10010207_43630 [Streptomyces atratus]|uniref:hypothetical protein n=1 Tax=Streptomyces atratus TaxID=1893 RepID=UPI0016701D95|nr:hypothetical protein [Streptomyces atratus]GGT38697.1 hypothetical protein GCM10010207_43630 [Streptomyces atratus]